MARLYEHQGKDLLASVGINVPRGQCASNAAAAFEAARSIEKPVVLKAQVWATGRFKAGGILLAKDPEEAAHKGEQLLGKTIKGLVVEKLLVEEQLDAERELYIGVIVSNSHKIKGPVLLFSSEGGSSIEEVSKRNPERIASLEVDYLKGVQLEDASRLVAGVTFEGNSPSEAVKRSLAKAICQVYQAFVQYDARSIEVNPLILTKDQRLVAADCHATIDDNSVFRHPELGIALPRDMERPPTELEKKAWKIENDDYRGTGYFAQMAPVIEGPGWLGFHGIGGGGAMLGASAFVAQGFKIANYADTSGDPPASKIYSVIQCILSQPVDGYVLMGACLANQEQWHHAHALVKAFREQAARRPGFPVIMLIGGNKEKEAHQIVRDGFKDLPLRWELYGREYIYDTDFISERVRTLVTDYQMEKKS
ncbi:MAG: acetate--CoA ligase family protein [Myxococcota bacterium]|jgi:succinyl-CoA synthetase beta subunit|nr:acetate--CoA ligase family protein [Myxococcota bacterium]